jgi:hypothetical protein
MNPGSQIKNSKLRGEWAELRFMTRAAEHGIMFSKPWGDSAPYDLMLEHQGRVLRIQVKSTMRKVRGIYRCHVPTAACHPEARAFCGPKDLGAPCEASRFLRGKNRTLGAHPNPRQSQIDFVAAYIIPEDLWYILPAPLATRLTGHISLSPHRKGHKYEPYLEAWHLLL